MHLRWFTFGRLRLWGRGRVLFDQHVGHQFGQVLDLRARFDHTFEHGGALWATHSYQLGLGLPDVVHAHVRDTLLARDVSDRRTATTAAATGTEARALHLAHFDTQGLEHGTRSFVLAVVTAQVARVVVGDAAALVLAEVELVGRDQFGDVGAVVLHLIVATKGAEVLENLIATDNPGGFAPGGRLNWAADLNLPLMSDKQQADVLFWVGDGAFDMRNQRTLRAFVKILKAANVDFAVLGLEERDSGDVARRLGDEATFQTLARRNIATLAKYRFKRIVSCDPHSFHVLKNEYGALGGNYQVLHHTTFIDELVQKGSLNLGQSKADSVTYHDPCYLGRYNGEYEAPRNVLKAIGIQVKEMERSGFRSRCCGGGGGAPITDIPGKQRIPDMRMVDIKETGAELVAVGCPQCTAMLEGVVAPRPEIKDIAELVAEVLIEATEVAAKKPSLAKRDEMAEVH